MSSKGKVLVFQIREAQPVPEELRARLAHEVAKNPAIALNGESLTIAALYQHATIGARLRIFEVLQQNGCDCLRCEATRTERASS